MKASAIGLMALGAALLVVFIVTMATPWLVTGLVLDTIGGLLLVMAVKR